MSVVCAWCHETLSEEEAGPVTHGICANCMADLQLRPESFPAFLNGLPGPVLAVDGEGRVLGFNIAAASVVRVEAEAAPGKLCGDVLSCAYARLPGGCGRTLHCTGCAIRRAFEHTAATGEPVRNAPAFAYRGGADAPIKQAYLVSTERIGPLILVQLEEAPADADVPGRPPA